MDYTELLKTLKEKTEYFSSIGFTDLSHLVAEAAAAIEELLRRSTTNQEKE